METTTQRKDSDDAAQIVEAEVAEKGRRNGNESIELISAFASWTRPACMKTFWRLYLTGLLASTGGMYVELLAHYSHPRCDGIQY